MGRMSLGAVLTAIVTPFDEQGKVDEDAFVALLKHVCAHGSDGVVVCGTTGECPTLTDEEHLALIELACDERPAGKTIIGGTGSNDTRHAIHLTEQASSYGVDAVLSVTPYYNKPNLRGLKAHYEAVAGATDKPVILYNIPGRVVVNVPPDALAELGQIERVDYVKQANADELQPIEGLGIYAGDDTSFRKTLEIGGVGGILVASHLVGEEMAEMVTADATRRAEIDDRLRPFFECLGVTTNPIPIKKALELCGHPVGGLRLPLVEADEAETAVVREALAGLGLLDRVAG